jgi:ribosomal protein S17
MPALVLALTSCSSPPPPSPPPAAAPVPAASSPAHPGLIDAGVIMDTASGMVTVESIDTTNRTLVLKRANGDTATFKAGPEIRRFNQIKVGDQIMSTVTDNCTIFVVKGKMTPSAAAGQAVVRTPEGQNLGGIVVNAINLTAKVLDVDLEARRVLLQYDPTQTKSVKVRPGVDLGKVAVGDTVLVRGTRTISIMVGNP